MQTRSFPETSVDFNNSPREFLFNCVARETSTVISKQYLNSVRLGRQNNKNMTYLTKQRNTAPSVKLFAVTNH
jgi:hypothetical protein